MASPETLAQFIDHWSKVEASEKATAQQFLLELCALLEVAPPTTKDDYLHFQHTRIVAEVERRLSVIEELETMVSANLQRATRLRQSILHRAFSFPQAEHMVGLWPTT